MAHKTLVGGTAYEISGGKTLVGGTAYNISNGKTLVGGTAYTIGFLSLPPAGTALSNCTPEQIKAVAQWGLGSSYWSVGDMIGIYLNGTVGALTLSGTYYAFIIGFNHNSSREGSGTIHFQFGKTSGGVDIAFVDGNYKSNGSSAGFRMSTSVPHGAGWASSYMRQTICIEFLSVLPAAWQNVIAPCTKYTDNVGGGSLPGNDATKISATVDKIWLLSEYEAFGEIKYSNEAESKYQTQYTYYANGNNLYKHRHDDATTKVYQWLRSVHSNYAFCAISTVGNSNYHDYTHAYYSYGFAPGFMVA